LEDPNTVDAFIALTLWHNWKPGKISLLEKSPAPSIFLENKWDH